MVEGLFEEKSGEIVPLRKPLGMFLAEKRHRLVSYRFTISMVHLDLMGMDTNKLTSLRPLYMGIIENVAPKRST